MFSSRPIRNLGAGDPSILVNGIDIRALNNGVLLRATNLSISFWSSIKSPLKIEPKNLKALSLAQLVLPILATRSSGLEDHSCADLVLRYHRVESPDRNGQTLRAINTICSVLGSG